MQLGMIGLGKMGANMTTRLLRNGHQVVAFDFSKDAVKASEKEGATGVASVDELVGKLSAPRVAWMMVP
ncbi:MAG: NAD(P)-binding domain-containing protein, partial [Vulcanimicrobiaceae bacterium]